jgi:Beta-ketoacyl synthase, N-terminal domain
MMKTIPSWNLQSNGYATMQLMLLLLLSISLTQAFSLSETVPDRSLRTLRTTTRVSAVGQHKSSHLLHGRSSNQDSNTFRLSMSTTSEDTTATYKKPRVVVTGLGVISGCGIGATDFFQACCDGVSSLRKVQRFDVQHYPCQIASEVPDELFDPLSFFTNPKNVKSNDRFTHFAVAAARQALQDGSYGDTHETIINPSRIGVMVGTAFGGMETLEEETLKLHKKPERPKVLVQMYERNHTLYKIYKFLFFHYQSGKASSHICISLIHPKRLGFTIYHSSITW